METSTANSSSPPPAYRVGDERLIKVTPGAAEKVTSLLNKQGRPKGVLRVAVIGGGCSGLQYKMDLQDGPANRDILVESGGIRVVVDPKSALYVTGSELDFVEALRWLREKWNVRRLLCEGGGEINAGLFRQGVVDEIHLTMSPLIFGGRPRHCRSDRGHSVALEIGSKGRRRAVPGLSGAKESATPRCPAGHGLRDAPHGTMNLTASRRVHRSGSVATPFAV